MTNQVKIKTLNEGLNDRQLEIATTFDGMLMADAGPGTGKTSTITERYANMIVKGIDPTRILMVTFTRNSARDMQKKLTERLTSLTDQIEGPKKAVEDMQCTLRTALKSIRVSTFDAYCLKIVQNSPEAINEFFGFSEPLSRGATLVENENLNKRYFEKFYASFTEKNGHYYRKKGHDIPMMVAENVGDLYDLIIRLMSFGIIPQAHYTWFGDSEKKLRGDTDEVASRVRALSENDKIGKIDKDYASDFPQWVRIGRRPKGMYRLTEKEIESIAKDFCNGDEKYRDDLIYFIWHVYYEYLRSSVRDNRLTFSLVKIFSFAILLTSEFARKHNSVDYLVVDEFQDTDEIQLKICLMLLDTNNLCVVGDWKQGIYGFRNASVDNILSFKERAEEYARELAASEFGNCVRGSFKQNLCKEVRMDLNYRSTGAILTEAFRAMDAPGTKSEIVQNKKDSITALTSMNETSNEYKDLYLKYTGTEYWTSDDRESEYSDLVDKVTEYVHSGEYKIIGKDGKLDNPTFGDIGVLFFSYKGCKGFYDEARKRGIPVFLQGDFEIMASPIAKLVLAWLRFVNNPNDTRGAVALLLHENYSMAEIEHILSESHEEGKSLTDTMPPYLVREREFLESKRKRPNELLTSIFAFHRIGIKEDLDANIAQSIINIITSSYDGTLMTVPGIIRFIEDEIKKPNKYPLDTILNRNAVTVQTMHKSKGLEYPIVIVGGITEHNMPRVKRNDSIFLFDETYGIRCSKECITSNSGMKGVVRSWKYDILRKTMGTDYYESRRLLFVSMSRAKQYMLVASRPKPSSFFDYLANGKTLRRPRECEGDNDTGEEDVADIPSIDRYKRRRTNLAVHDIMDYREGDGGGKGKLYGTKVHEMAEQMAHDKDHSIQNGIRFQREYKDVAEIDQVAKVLEGVKDAVRIETEYECALPVEQATIRGTIDLIAFFNDRIEIHDYKTDDDKRNIDSYITQLSVYGLAAQQLSNVPVKCFIDFVSIPELSVEVKLLSMEEIQKKVDAYLEESAKVE